MKDGTLSVPGVQFEHVEISPIIGAFRRMCRALEFDVCEMAITTYLTAKAYDKPFTALPIFVMRQFHHSPIVCNTNSGVKSPKDLEGKEVGVRAYTVTTGVWARGILATEYGVDLDKVTWVVVDEEHVQEYRKPANVLERPGGNLAEMLLTGGARGRHWRRQDRFSRDQAADPRRGGRRSRLVPKDRGLSDQPDGGSQGLLLQSDPSLAPRLFAGFEAAKAQFLKQLSEGGELPPDAEALAKRRSIVGDDPLPNGLECNRKRWKRSSGSHTSRRSCLV